MIVEHRIRQEETEFDFHALNEKVFQGYPGLNGVKSSIWSVMRSVEEEAGMLFCLNASGETEKTKHTQSISYWPKFDLKV